MSSILDALRKLEEQKRVRKQQAVDLSEGFLASPGRSATRNLSRGKFLFALSLVALLSIGGTALVMRRGSAPVPQSKAVGAVEATRAPTPSHKAAPQMVPQNPQKVPAAPRKPLPEVTQKSRTAPAAYPRKLSLPAVLPETERQAVPETTPPSTASPAAKTYRLTGIGSQRDAASRYAVINGSALTEGGIVDGARVEEILQDKVRLKVNGESIDLQLGK